MSRRECAGGLVRERKRRENIAFGRHQGMCQFSVKQSGWRGWILATFLFGIAGTGCSSVSHHSIRANELTFEMTAPCKNGKFPINFALLQRPPSAEHEAAVKWAARDACRAMGSASNKVEIAVEGEASRLRPPTAYRPCTPQTAPAPTPGPWGSCSAAGTGNYPDDTFGPCA